jgi:hypothetical protein
MWRTAVLGLLAACGDGLTLPDAATPPDSDVGLVRVQYLGGVPAGNVVMFQNPDGSLALATHTDSDGRANAYMRAGGSTTIIGTNDSTHLLFTWMDVQPGDELVLDRRAFSNVPFEKAHQVTVPIAPGAGTYQLRTSCGSFIIPAFDVMPQVVVDLRRCQDRTDMLVLADPTFNAGRYLHAADVPLAAIDIDLAGEYTPFDTTMVNVSGAPIDSRFGVVTQYLIAQDHELYQTTSRTLTLSQGLGQLIQQMPRPAASTLMTTVAFDFPEGSIGAYFATRWGPAKVATPINVSTTRPHAYTKRPVYDPNQQRVEWTETTTGVLAEAVLLQVGWSRPGVGDTYRWQVLAPRGVDPVVQLPQLPGRDWTPREGDAIEQPTILANLKLEGGYDSIRTSLLGRWTPGETWPPNTAAGSVVFENVATPF